MKNAHRKERKIRRIPPSVSSEVALAPDEPSIESPNETPIDSGPTTKRIAVPITSDGRIDVTGLREKTKVALRHALSDPSLSASLGTPTLESVQSSEDAALVAQLTDSLFTGVSALSVALAMRAGYRPEHARVLVWDEKEKATVAPMTSKVVNKYLPMLEGKYREEILLGYQVLTIIGAKIILLREVAKQPIAQPSEAVS